MDERKVVAGFLWRRTLWLAAGIAAALIASSAVGDWRPRSGREPASSDPTHRGGSNQPTQPRVRQIGPSSRPLAFEENRGQTDAAALFLVRLGGGIGYVTRDGVVLSLLSRSSRASKGDDHAPLRGPSMQAEAVGISFVGASNAAAPAGRDRQSGVSNYLRGRDRGAWLEGVPHYGHVLVRDLYPGTDLDWHTSPSGLLEYHLVVHPDGDPGAIRFRIDGAKSVAIGERGDLEIATAHGVLRQSRPVMHQPSSGGTDPAPGAFELEGPREVVFRIPAYDKSRPLVIDPTLSWATYLGGEATESLNGTGNFTRNFSALGTDGAAYITAMSMSPDFPTTPGAYDREYEKLDAVVTKLASDGRSLIFSTFMTGTGSDGYTAPTAIAVDAEGSVYLCGTSQDGSGWPITAGAPQTTITPAPPNPWEGTGERGKGGDLFVTKLNPLGDDVVYSTFWGGSGWEHAMAIAIDDDDGSAVICGTTGDSSLGVSPVPLVEPFPVVAPYQAALAGGGSDGFVAKLNPSGTAFVFSTFLGGSLADSLQSLAIDSDGTIVVAGETESKDYPLLNAFQREFGIYGRDYPPRYAEGTDLCITRLRADGQAILYSTYLGGSKYESYADVAVDGTGAIVVTGNTNSNYFPTTPDAFQKCYPDFAVKGDVFVTKIAPSGTSLEFSTMLWGTSGEAPVGVGIDAAGHVYVGGRTNSTDFPLKYPLQAERGYVFLTKFNRKGTGLIYSTYFDDTKFEHYPASGWRPESLEVSRSGTVMFAGLAAGTDCPVTPGALQASLGGSYDLFVVKFESGPIPVPAPPTGLLAASVSASAVDLSWTDETDDETGYQIERRTGDGAFSDLASVKWNETAFQDGSVEPLSSYTYRVSALYDEGRSSSSNEASVRTPPSRWLELRLGRSCVQDATTQAKDKITVSGIWYVVDSPIFEDPMDPRAGEFTFEAGAPGGSVRLTIPAADPGWKVSKKGVYTWKTPRRTAPAWRVVVQPRKSTFTISTTKRTLEFPVENPVTVSLLGSGAFGVETSDWDVSEKLPRGVAARLTRPRPR